MEPRSTNSEQIQVLIDKLIGDHKGGRDGLEKCDLRKLGWKVLENVGKSADFRFLLGVEKIRLNKMVREKIRIGARNKYINSGKVGIKHKQSQQNTTRNTGERMKTLSKLGQ